jgi:hypothetical protein
MSRWNSSLPVIVGRLPDFNELAVFAKAVERAGWHFALRLVPFPLHS